MTQTVMSVGHQLAGVERLIEPYLQITSMAWWPMAGTAGTIRVDAQIKPSGLAPGALPPAMRVALFETAQTVIRVVEEAGYRHSMPPQISISGDVTQAGDTVYIETTGNVQFELQPLGDAG